MSRFTDAAQVAHEMVAHEAAVTGVALRLSCSGGIARVSAKFTPGDRDAYVEAEGACLMILARCIATRPGSTWGHDGVGGALALKSGYLTINKSGIAPSFAKALQVLV